MELGEIDYQLHKRLPLNAQALVELIKPAGHDGRPSLAAFILLSDHHAVSSSDATVRGELTEELQDVFEKLRGGLTETLPPYMVPSYYVPLNFMPRSRAGKADRKRLQHEGSLLLAAELRMYALSANTTKRQPSTPMECLMCDIWAAELKLPRDTLGADDDFFRIGGDSLFAIKIVARARAEGVLLTVADMFQSPRLADVARTATTQTQAGSAPLIAPYELLRSPAAKAAVLAEIDRCGQYPPSTVQDIYPCTPLQESMMVLTLNDPSAYVMRHPYRLPSTMDVGRYMDAWATLVRNTAILRTCHRAHRGVWDVPGRPRCRP